MNKGTSNPGSSSSVVHAVRPKRDLTTNWEVDLVKELEDNLLKICSGTITGEDEARIQVNFSEAALLIQNSVQVHSRKVEYLYTLVLRTIEFLSHTRYIPVSFNQAIGATTPFFTAIFAYVMIRKREAWVTYATLLPVVAGVLIASGGKAILLSSILVM